MASSLHSQSSSSHTSSITSRHRNISADKPGLVPHTSSTSSLHRSASNKNNSSTGLASKSGKHPHNHHLHVAHTSASKHNRTSSYGHRIPSYGKGLNKLTALTAINPGDAPREHFSTHSLANRAGGVASLRRSHSEGSGIFPCFPPMFV